MSAGRLLKAEGAGNDFLVGLGGWARRLADDAELVRRLCRRHRGIGADGVLAVLPEADGALRIVHRNADASPSAFCANGSRCAALAASRELGLGPDVVLRTGWGDVAASVRGDGTVTLGLPPPPAPPRALVLEAAGRTWSGWLVTVGVPHLVVPVDDPETIEVDQIGGTLRRHPGLGPDGANVDLVGPVAGPEVALRTFERGVEGETCCCGTGAVAVALSLPAAVAAGRLAVRCRSGDVLTVELTTAPPCASSRLTGPARLVARVEPVTP